MFLQSVKKFNLLVCPFFIAYLYQKIEKNLCESSFNLTFEHLSDAAAWDNMATNQHFICNCIITLVKQPGGVWYSIN